MSIRCFVAIECGGNELAAKFTDVRTMLETTRADVKFVEPENVHLTLKFLGEIMPSLVEQVSQVVKDTGFQPFSARLEGVGVFPNLRRPRVVWAGISDGVSQLVEVWRLREGEAGVQPPHNHRQGQERQEPGQADRGAFHA